MPNTAQHYIDGAWVDPVAPRPFRILDPALNAPVGEVALGDAADVDAAVAAARRAFDGWSRSAKLDRLEALRRLEQAFAARLEEMAQAISTEMGAPLTMAREEQAQCGVDNLRSFIDELEAHETVETLPGGDVVLREPIGVCGLVTPWNWPVNQIALKVAPAIAAGCACVLKPSEHTPLSAALFAQIVDEAGLPPGVFNLVQGDGETVGEAMSRHPGIDMMSFTGSTRAGVLVSRAAAETVKRVTLELGGKSPNLVFADADLEARVPASVAECFHNSGQSCNAPTRLLVERACYDRVLALAAQACADQAVGDPAREGGHIGPLFDEIQYERVQALIRAGLNEGARLLAGGPGKPEGLEQGWYARPTIFADVSNDMRIAREEVFGPVLVIIPFETEEEAIALANDTDYGLAAYLQTGDAARAERVTARLRAGQVTVNGNAPGYLAPFGGYKRSGNGREGGRFGLEDYQEIKVRGPFFAG
ncbi:MAG: aldehyde dehydrogenase family protein [Pseudomonadota bacterium]